MKEQLSKVGLEQAPIIKKNAIEELVKQIREASSADLKAGAFDNEVMRAIDLVGGTNKIRDFREIATALFGGRYNEVGNYHLYFLRTMLIAIDQAVSVQITSLQVVMRESFKRWKELYRIPDMLQAEPQSCIGRYIVSEEEKNNPHAKVRLIHGGGLRFCRGVKAADIKGYRLDHVGNKFPGYGIYFAPMGAGYDTRAYQYALRAATRNCDTPVLVTCEIEQQYLVKTPNSSYEVGVLDENFDKLENFMMTPLTFFQCARNTSSQNPYAETDILPERVYSELYSDYPDVYEDFLRIQEDASKSCQSAQRLWK